MSNIKPEDQAEQDAGTRTGGNVQTKGPSKAPAADSGQRTGGNVQTKGAGGGGTQPAGADRSDERDTTPEEG